MFKRWEAWVGIVIGILAIVGSVFGAFNFLDTRFAEEEKVEQIRFSVDEVGKRLDFKIVKDKFQAVQERMWSLEDRHGGKELKDADTSTKEEYRNLQVQQDDLRSELKGEL